MNAAVFHQRFRDFQLNTFNGTVFIVQTINSCSTDLDEADQWGFEELHRIQQAQRAIAQELVGEPDIPAAYAALDADPARRPERIRLESADGGTGVPGTISEVVYLGATTRYLVDLESGP